MSDENCLGGSKNIKNHLKTRYPTDFVIGPIEYIYVCVCVCGIWTSYENQKNIYGLKPLES
jgi:hypothetical protein